MFFFICSNEVAMNINSDERKILVSRKFGAKKGGYIFVRRDLFEKVDKNSGFTNCAASVFNHIAAGHGTRAFVGLLPAETRFSQSVTRSLWSKQLSRCFYRANTGLNQYFIRRKTIEITPFFFSLSSLLSSLSFFLSQSKWKLHLSSSLCTIQTCFIDYRTLQLQLEHVSILSLKSSVSTTSILVYHYTCTRLRIKFLSFSLFENFIAMARISPSLSWKYAPLRFFVFRYKSSELGRFDEWEPRLKS